MARSQTAPFAHRSTLSISNMGQYFYWIDGTVGQNQSRWFRRRFAALVGTISENMFWTGKNWIDNAYVESGRTILAKNGSETRVLANKSLVVGSGATLTCEAGSTLVCEAGAQIIVEQGGQITVDKGTFFKMGVGSQIVVDGSFVARGVVGHYIVFALEGTSGRWNGIIAPGSASGSTLVLDHANIHFANVAVHVGNTVSFSMNACTVEESETGVEIVAMSEGETELPSLLLSNNIFANISQGISLDRTSNLSIDDNVLTGIDKGGSGITCISSSPTLLRNHLENFKIGLECTNASSPILEENQYGGNNIITNNSCGVTCSGGSMPNLGAIGPIGTDVGGQNSIFENDVDVEIVDEGITIIAENNWWGSENNPPGVFVIAPGSTLVYEPFLESDPNAGNRPSTRLHAKGLRTTSGGITNRVEPLPELMKLAAQARKERDYRRASNLLKSIVAAPTMPQYAKQWALSQLLAVGQRMREQNLNAYMLGVGNSRPVLLRNMRLLLPLSYWSDGMDEQALAAFGANVQQYPNSVLARAGLYGKFTYALYNVSDTSQARSLLNTLQAVYPMSTEARIAAQQMSNYRSVFMPPTIHKANSNQPPQIAHSSTPVGFRVESYPNPFNPSTQIKFDLPEASHVSLAVYDVLGRKVAELVNGQVAVGYHSVTWNASGVASGMYFARFTATDANGNLKLNKVSKLLLTK
ncbi:MAG: T9SS type A sorting domain-containing protein [Ignavibacteriae bacterium]|nr:T9SS type A sorting domain-containing protein [Ignavibacteriota bacterium]